ncbi:MAG: hypothetical protein QOJ96_1563 [Alphaproteobacteria bacterium]|jgi:hypothetical protein|nr:hypothetical protein [Alphaproteobacteria bacterium]
MTEDGFTCIKTPILNFLDPSRRLFGLPRRLVFRY